jgi:hypothetical protein
LGNFSDRFPVYAGFTLDLMLGNSPLQQNDDRAVLVLRQDILSFCPRRYVEGLMMSCRLARPKSGLIERQLLGDFGVATDGGIWVDAGAKIGEFAMDRDFLERELERIHGPKGNGRSDGSATCEPTM